MKPSPQAPPDASKLAITDASPEARGAQPSLFDRHDGRRCSWCKNPIPEKARVDSVFCGRKCRQRAFRIRRRTDIETSNEQPKRVAYADPPYPGFAWMYADQDSYGGEVDHAALVAKLEAEYDGFALSTSAKTLAQVLSLFTVPVHVCAWVKPIGVSSETFGIHNTWEPLIVKPARELRPGKRDWLAAQPARRGGSTLIGRKPEAFATWMFALIGALPGDTLDDLFPGSGMIGKAWAELNRAVAVDVG